MIDWPASDLGKVLREIESRAAPPSGPRLNGPFEMVLWEIVAYLADDETRASAFQALRDQVGLTPEAILAAPTQLLVKITRMGGSIAAQDRAERLKSSAVRVIEEFDGDLGTVLKLPPQKAKKALMKFPMIGEPGAEKILLFLGVLSVLALESNGLRLLTRLGFGREQKSYSATYAALREVTIEQLPQNAELLRTAHLLLKRHGQTVCLRNGPVCTACSVNFSCRFYNLQRSQ
jgi:endonuclease-3